MEPTNYYELLGISHKFTAFRLVHNYFKRTRNALAARDLDRIIKLRMGFEVLRSARAVEEYNRIYRKYVLKQELNYPFMREEEMVKCIQEHESIGKELAVEIIQTKKSYYRLVLKFYLWFLVVDMFGCLMFYNIGGTLFFIFGLAVCGSFVNLSNVIPGVALMIFGLFMLRYNFINYVLKE